MFVFQAEPPNSARIPVADLVGVTVVLLTCSYRSAEFIRVGYYVSNDYLDPELKENPPATPLFDKLQRNILASNPRVTKFKIDWELTNGENSENFPPKFNPNQSNTESSHSLEEQLKCVAMES